MGGVVQIIGILSVCGIPVVATILATAWLCRYRLSRNKGISYGTMLAGACAIPLLVAVVATCFQPDIWWSREHKMTPEIVITMLGFMAAICVLPALGVVVCYQRRRKNGATVRI